MLLCLHTIWSHWWQWSMHQHLHNEPTSNIGPLLFCTLIFHWACIKEYLRYRAHSSHTSLTHSVLVLALAFYNHTTYMTLWTDDTSAIWAVSSEMYLYGLMTQVLSELYHLRFIYGLMTQVLSEMYHLRCVSMDWWHKCCLSCIIWNVTLWTDDTSVVWAVSSEMWLYGLMTRVIWTVSSEIYLWTDDTSVVWGIMTTQLLQRHCHASIATIGIMTTQLLQRCHHASIVAGWYSCIPWSLYSYIIVTTQLLS